MIKDLQLRGSRHKCKGHMRDRSGKLGTRNEERLVTNIDLKPTAPNKK
jgi:hypothetical protein